MSKFTTAYDAFLSNLVTLFPNKTYIPNPYSLDDNAYIFLRDGYGLKLDTEEDTPSQFNYFTTYHSFTVVLTREVARTDSDATPIHTVAKLLKEDVYSLKTSVYDSNNLSVPDDIDLINFGSTSGVSSFLVGNNSFMSIESTFLILIREQATNC